MNKYSTYILRTCGKPIHVATYNNFRSLTKSAGKELLRIAKQTPNTNGGLITIEDGESAGFAILTVEPDGDQMILRSEARIVDLKSNDTVHESTERILPTRSSQRN